jgi:hypothetical protein
VFAFERGRAALEARGLSFTDVGIRIPSLAGYLAALPHGALVAIAISADANQAGRQSMAAGAGEIGGGPASRWPGGSAVAVVGVAGAAVGATSAAGARSVRLVIRGGEPLTGTRVYLPGTIVVSVGERGVSIGLDWRWKLEADTGLAVAVFDTAGNLIDRQTAGASGDYSLASHTGRARLFRLR